MKYSLQFLRKENDLNKILSQQKGSKANMSILFVSEWDRWCQNLTYELKKKLRWGRRGREVVYCKQL